MVQQVPRMHSDKRGMGSEKKVKYRKVSSAAKANDELGVLETMRDRVAKAIDDSGTSARDLASLTKRLREIMEDIAQVKASRGEEAVVLEIVEDSPFDAQAI